MIPTTRIKLIISIIGIGLITLYLFWPNKNIDVFLLVLVLVVLFPWVSPLVQSAEFPGGFKIEFREVENAGKKVTDEKDSQPSSQKLFSATETTVLRPSYLSVAENDPNLALVGLRIEIEKRLRLLALKHGIKSDKPISLLTDELGAESILDADTTDGLSKLIEAGNKAAHGATVDSMAVNWAFEEGPKILSILDLKRTAVEYSVDDSDIDLWLERARTILEFEGQDVIDFCISLLSHTKRDGTLKLHLGFNTTRERAGNILIRLDALEPTERQFGKYSGWSAYQMTTKGETLLSTLLAESIDSIDV